MKDAATVTKRSIARENIYKLQQIYRIMQKSCNRKKIQDNSTRKLHAYRFEPTRQKKNYVKFFELMMAG